MLHFVSNFTLEMLYKLYQVVKIHERTIVIGYLKWCCPLIIREHWLTNLDL